MDRKNQKINKIVLGGVMVALGTILSLIKVYQLPFGGAITLCSMLPILLYAYKYGIKWGIYIGFVYSITQFVLGTGAIKGYDFLSTSAIIFFDFVLAFSVLGFAGVFRKSIKHTTISFALGSALSMLIRYISHIISGVIFFGNYAEGYFAQDGMRLGEWVLGNFSGNSLIWIYSTIYNGSFMLPELVITIIVGCAVIKIIGKQIFSENNTILQ